MRAVQANATNIFNAPVGGVAGLPLNANLANYYVANTNHFQNNTINEQLTNQTTLVGKFNTGTFEHTTVSGVELSRENRDHYRTMITGASRVNIAAPDPYPAAAGVLAPTTALTSANSRTVGVFVSDQIKINRYFELLAGLRFDRFDSQQRVYTLTTGTTTVTALGNGTTPAYLDSGNQFLSYRVGAVAHPVPEMSLYYMRGTSANPAAEFVALTNGQQNLDPVTNITDEVGVKYDVLGGAVSLTAAIFRTEQQNAYENLGTTAAPNFVTVGTTRVQGFEAGIVGRLTRQWNVMLGYTYLDSAVVSTVTVANIGNRLANTPQHSGSVWTTYDFTPKLTMGGGAFYVGDRFTSVANTSLAPGYWRVDAMAAYKVTDRFTMQLNVYNLADTVNYESLAGAGWVVPGPPRSVSLTGRVQF